MTVPTEPAATCAACPGWNMRLEHHFTADGLTKAGPNKFLVPTHQPQHQSPSKQTVPESEGKNEKTTTWRCRRQNRRVLRIARLAESELRRKVSSDWVQWIEFKPGRSTGPTENDRSSRSSDDLSKEEMWPTRTVAVALVGMCRSEDEGKANHMNRSGVSRVPRLHAATWPSKRRSSA